MKKRWIVVIALLLLFATFRPRHRTTNNMPALPKASTPVPATQATSPAASVPLPAPRANPSISREPSPAVPASPAIAPEPGANIPAPATPAALTEVRDEIENVQFALRDYRTSLGENPIGNNAEITKALLGDNLKQVKIPLPPGATVNGEGQMCDRWGTPYFFHQLSAKQMEVRSAGPDREMWTGDDLVVK